MDLELISFKLCPFVQRSVITLNYKSIDHRITYIDLADPPAWFKTISPFGKVPLLRIDGKTVLFESAVINEFLDDVTPPSLHPADPLQRALNRAWIEFGSECLANQFQIVTAKDQQTFRQKAEELRGKMQRLEGIVGNGPYFNGPDLALIDTAYAPLFMRMKLLINAGVLENDIIDTKVTHWANTLLALNAVRNSVVSDFEALYLRHLQKLGGHVANLI